MPERLVISDATMLIDANRRCVLDEIFTSNFIISVPDLFYERELKPYGSNLLKFGLEILELDGVGVQSAIQYQRLAPALSLSQAFALALAQRTRATLLTCEKRLKCFATKEGIHCNDDVWLRQHLTSRREVQLYLSHHNAMTHPE